ncbi:hypothetical protein AVEN_234672-1 [Araneus ventricosus]|uniref:Uncharacterized protein n=1 Tax=Araneus ventricosus TaxID=182803 RepID=A0A4Y2D1I7_ARAVE|nr:hypothetical protein AVEN_234672-1 [Araneus ventricosus]
MRLSKHFSQRNLGEINIEKSSNEIIRNGGAGVQQVLPNGTIMEHKIGTGTSNSDCPSELEKLQKVSIDNILFLLDLRKIAKENESAEEKAGNERNYKNDDKINPVTVFRTGVRGASLVLRESMRPQSLFGVLSAMPATNLRDWPEGRGLKAILLLWPHIDKIRHCIIRVTLDDANASARCRLRAKKKTAHQETLIQLTKTITRLRTQHVSA